MATAKIRRIELIKPRLVLNNGISGHQFVHRFVGNRGARFQVED